MTQQNPTSHVSLAQQFDRGVPVRLEDIAAAGSSGRVSVTSFLHTECAVPAAQACTVHTSQPQPFSGGFRIEVRGRHPAPYRPWSPIPGPLFLAPLPQVAHTSVPLLFPHSFPTPAQGPSSPGSPGRGLGPHSCSPTPYSTPAAPRPHSLLKAQLP